MSIKISQLPAASAVTSDDLFSVVDTVGLVKISKKATAQQILQFITSSVFSDLTVNILDGTTANFVSFTGSFSGNGSQITDLTASNITNFTADVRSKFTAGPGITINDGQISASTIPNESLQFDSITIGTTNIALGSTGSILQNITTISSSNITGSTAQFSVVSGTTISASTYVGIPNPELTKIIVDSSVPLLATQRAVFATNFVSSSITITLPDISSADSREYYIIKADDLSGSVIVSGSGSDLINGQGTFMLNGPYQSITLITDGANWFIF